MKLIEQAISLHRQGRLAEAEVAYGSILAQHPNQFDALHWLGVLKAQQGQAHEARDLLSAAVKRRPNSTDTLTNLGVVLVGLQRHEEALACFEQVLKRKPRDATALFNRAAVLAQLGRVEAALSGYDQALAIAPDDLSALFNRANLLAQLERYEAALAGYERILALAPGTVGAIINRGNVLVKLEQFKPALDSFDRVLRVEPDHLDALNNRGAVLRKLGRPEEALASYERSLAINSNQFDALFNRANALAELNRAPQALADYQRALALKGEDVDALVGSANMLLRLNHVDEALASLDRALAASPGNKAVLASRAMILARRRQFDLATQDYREILVLTPDDRDAVSGLASCLSEMCDWSELPALIDRVNVFVATGEAIDPLLLLRFNDTPAMQQKCAEKFLHAVLPMRPHPLLAPQRSATSGKIRVAYLSPDFRIHPVAFLIPELLECHDHARFEIIGVSYGPDDGSDVRRRIVSAFDRFYDAMFISDHEVATWLHDAGVDIVVDLAGYSAHARQGVLARRPAPIQVNYLGFCGSLGADFIDYIIADQVVVPLTEQPCFSEKIVHLPECFMVQDTRQAVSVAIPSRRDMSLPEEALVFCCFNKSYKFTSQVFEAWMRLLRTVDGSVLWLTENNQWAVQNLRRKAEACGVEPSRLVFATAVPQREDHLARQRLADLFLDTLPHNAHTTASDALWAGLPVLTCRGETFAGRVAASLLQAVGLPELITTNLADYEALALKLAREPALLAELKAKLARNRATYPLFDTERFTRHIEAAYATMWDRWQRGEAPQSFSVEPI